MVSLRCAKGPSAARSFLRIARRGFSTATTQLAAPPEFLLPQAFTRTGSHAKFLFTSLSRNHPADYNPSRKLSSLRSLPQPQRRTFTATVCQKATACVLNPQTDEDGKEIMLEITPRAAKRLSEIMKKDGNPNLALRIQVESGGCHGFQYLMSLVTIPPKYTEKWSTEVNEDDTVFQFFSDSEEPDSSLPACARVILDKSSLDLLKGSKVDFTMELIGSQFKIVDNPYATSSCGCGTSFDIKI